MSAHLFIRRQANSATDVIRSHPYISLMTFVTIVVAVSVAGYTRYQHVQAELAAQQEIRYRIQKGFDDWRDDLLMRADDLKDGIQGTAKGAGKMVGGAWGITRFTVTAILDYVGNLHIMIPVTIIYFGVGFFGTLKMRVATLIGALIAFWASTNFGIVQGSIIGLLAIAGLLFWNKIDPRLLTRIHELPASLKSRIQRARNTSADEAHRTQ